MASKHKNDWESTLLEIIWLVMILFVPVVSAFFWFADGPWWFGLLAWLFTNLMYVGWLARTFDDKAMAEWDRYWDKKEAQERAYRESQRKPQYESNPFPELGSAMPDEDAYWAGGRRW